MARDNTRPIIIRKVIEESHGGHHGGAWKVAYADFVTAMMAFFLLLWLISSASEDTKKGLSEYFSDLDENRVDKAAVEGVFTGTTILDGQSLFQIPAPPFSEAGIPVIQNMPSAEIATVDSWEAIQGSDAALDATLSDAEFERERQRREQEQFEEAKSAILKNLMGSAELAKFKDSLIIKPTPEGLRIELIDQAGVAMFPLGSDRMFDHTRQLLEVVVQAIADLPQKVSIEGHTDAHPFADGAAYDNWSLSTDRAHATRRQLLRTGLNAGRIAEVVGKGDADLLLPEAPHDPRNRRISVVLLRAHAGAKPDAVQPSGAPPSPDRQGEARTDATSLPHSLTGPYAPIAGQSYRGQQRRDRPATELSADASANRPRRGIASEAPFSSLVEDPWSPPSDEDDFFITTDPMPTTGDLP